MNKEHEIATSFYQAFGRLDAAAMNAHYATNATFYDPVFEHLDARETRGMWQMLCKNAKNLTVSFEIVEAGKNRAKVNWIASYDFSKTGRRVENRISTLMELQNNLIVKQVDSFDFARWARQAFGLPGYVLGYLPPFRSKVQKSVRESLNAYLSANA